MAAAAHVVPVRYVFHTSSVLQVFDGHVIFQSASLIAVTF